ncbi:MAG: hypothetical protein KTR15_02220 [Phycisphaeraceae bacterium]|nr:hypothetical protein [Phycisphaeraceae bacterium]
MQRNPLGQTVLVSEPVVEHIPVIQRGVAAEHAIGVHQRDMEAALKQGHIRLGMKPREPRPPDPGVPRCRVLGRDDITLAAIDLEIMLGKALPARRLALQGRRQFRRGALRSNDQQGDHQDWHKDPQAVVCNWHQHHLTGRDKR